MKWIPTLTILGSCVVALILLGGCGSESKSAGASTATQGTKSGGSPSSTPSATVASTNASSTSTTPASATVAAPTAAATTTAAPAAATQTSAPAPPNTPAPAQPATPAPAQPATATPRPPTAAPPTIAPAPTATSVAAGYSLPACYVAGQDKCNCPNFSTQAYAQWFHNTYDLADVNRLDGSPKNGVVCESNP